MGTNDVRKSCVKCQKMVESSEKVLVCGLWCRKAFHNDCVGLTNSETRVVTCSNERIKFHCETCENRLGMELLGEQNTHETNKLQNCVNDCLLELVERILKLANELSNDNSVINRKLDTVISTNTRLEEYILQSPKRLEKRGEEITDNSVECVERLSAPLSQQTDGNSSSVHIASDIPIQLSHKQDPLVAEESSSDCLQELEMNDDHSLTQDLPSTNKEECIPAEEFIVHSVCSIVKTEYEGGEEKAEIENKEEECSSSEDLLECGSSSMEKIEDDVDREPGSEDIFEELKHEVEPGSNDKPESSTIAIGLEDHSNKGCRSHLVTKDSWTSGKGHRIQCTTKQEVSCGNNKTLQQKTPLKQHPQLYSGQRPSSCNVWKHTFTEKSNLRKHSRLHSGECPFSCSVCSKQFTENSMLQKHSMVHSGECPFSCNICNQTLTHKHHSQDHLWQQSSERPFSCSVCKKTFTQKSYLRVHLRLHSGERPFSCSVCTQTFIRKHHLQDHLRQHSGDRPYSCSVCYQTFTYKHHMEDHLRKHSGERPFSCSVCNKTFTGKGNLRKHSKVHSGERPFSCSICNKIFTRKSILQQHSLVHSGERPFSCSVCNQTFTRKHHLQDHLRQHSGERPFSCSVCNKTFIQKSSLRAHSRLHSGERPFSCSVCNKTFIDSGKMMKHFCLHPGKVH